MVGKLIKFTPKEISDIRRALDCLIEAEGDTKSYTSITKKLIEKQPNYEAGFNILMEYWDSINDEEKPKADKRLTRCGL